MRPSTAFPGVASLSRGVGPWRNESGRRIVRTPVRLVMSGEAAIRQVGAGTLFRYMAGESGMEARTQRADHAGSGSARRATRPQGGTKPPAPAGQRICRAGLASARAPATAEHRVHRRQGRRARWPARGARGRPAALAGLSMRRRPGCAGGAAGRWRSGKSIQFGWCRLSCMRSAPRPVLNLPVPRGGRRIVSDDSSSLTMAPSLVVEQDRQQALKASRGHPVEIKTGSG